MNSFYEADFASVMAPAQSSQQRVAVKGELWHDGGTKKESTCTWLNADRSPAQLFLMVMHWQEGRLFLIACNSFRHTKQPPSFYPSFVSNLHWPAFKAVSGSLAQKTLEESGCLQLDDRSRGTGIPCWTFPDFQVAEYTETINIQKNVYRGVKVYQVCYISS